jgi:rod shape-determining protein MreC
MRRDQNLAILGAVVTGAVVASGLFLLVLGRASPEAGARVRGVMLDMATPVLAVVRAPFDALAGLGQGVAAHFGTVERAARLETALAAAEARLQLAEADRLALAQLRRLERVAVPERQLVATARIVSVVQGGVVRSALVSAGSRQGVTAAMPVIGAEGLVGRTTDVGAGAARVLLLTDSQSRVPVLVARTGQAALVAGDGSPLLLLAERVGPEEPLRRGDRLVTSGEGGVFPPGVPVAVVDDAGPPVRLRPLARLLGAGFVRIEAGWLPDAAVLEMGEAPGEVVP